MLVIGGGDGGVLREIVKHDCVEEAVLVDIDEAVIRLSKKFLPGMSVGFQHPKVKVHVADGFEYLRNKQGEFDVIITDSSDPDGPAESLFQGSYFELLNSALREGGMITTQGTYTSGIHSLRMSPQINRCWHRREPMAPHAHNPTSQGRVQAHLPGRRLRMDYNPDISERTDGLYGLLQRSQPQCKEACTDVEPR